jgi:5-methylthioadenosine/S-adenosylhomocysteine deaminase
MSSLLVTGGLVVTMNPAGDELQADVLVRDGTIAAVGRDLGPADKHLDASGCLVLPGFIQTHLHLCQTLFRGLADDMDVVDWLRLRVWPLEQAHDARTIYDSARLGIAELLRGGTTCALTMETFRHTEAVFDAVVETGFRAFSGKAMMDRLEPGTEMIAETTADSLAATEELIDAYDGAGQGRLRYAFCPRGSRNCTDELWQEVASRSRRRSILIHTHAAENEAQTRRLASGRLGDVSYLHSVGATGPRSVLAHCIWLSADEVDILARTSTSVAHCPSCNLKLASGVARVPEMRARGIEVTLGADGAACNNNLDMFREMRLAALLHKPRLGPEALPAREVLEMATIGGARALGIADRLGSLEAGKRADLITVRRSALHAQPTDGGSVAGEVVYAHGASDVDAVVVDGHVLVRGGSFTQIDEEEIVRRANDSLRLLLSRAEGGAGVSRAAAR